MGNLLDKPSLLLKSQFIRDTNNSIKKPKEGRDFDYYNNNQNNNSNNNFGIKSNGLNDNIQNGLFGNNNNINNNRNYGLFGYSNNNYNNNNSLYGDYQVYQRNIMILI